MIGTFILESRLDYPLFAISLMSVTLTFIYFYISIDPIEACTKCVADNFVPGYTMKAHVGVALYLYAFLLIVTLDGGEWSVLRSGRFFPGEVALSIYRMEGWVAPVDLCALWQQKYLAIVGNQRPIRRSSFPLPSHYTACAIQIIAVKKTSSCLSADV